MLEEYKRLLKEAENSTGVDEEKLPQQIGRVRLEFERITDKKIDAFV